MAYYQAPTSPTYPTSHRPGYQSGNKSGYRSPIMANLSDSQTPDSPNMSRSFKSLPSIQTSFESQERWLPPQPQPGPPKLYPGPFWDRSRPRPAKPTKQKQPADFSGPFYDRSRPRREKKPVAAAYPGPFYDRSRPRTARAPSSQDPSSTEDVSNEPKSGVLGFFRRSSKQNKGKTSASRFDDISCEYNPPPTLHAAPPCRPPRSAPAPAPQMPMTSPRAASSCGVASDRQYSPELQHRTAPSSRATTPMPPSARSMTPMMPARATTPLPARSHTPTMPRSTTPSMPRSTTPNHPRSTTPNHPRSTTPNHPRSTTPSMPRSSTPVQPARSTTPLPDSRSTTPMPPTEPTPPLPTPSPESKSRMSKRSSKMGALTQSPGKAATKSKTSPSRQAAAWNPPPLFQAYGQAIRHATLEASTLSAEAILRGEVASKNRLDATIEEETPEMEGAAVNRGHKRSPSAPNMPGGWTQKIYFLVHPGYLLQYTGEGAFDRLPEKVLRLDKDSVAFATDILPGKHWVLQVSQLEDGGQTVDLGGARSRFSRLSFRSANSRRMTSNLLLVLDNPEEMDSWMSAIRTEIEIVGGKRHDENVAVAPEKTGEMELAESTGAPVLPPPQSIMQRYSMMPNSSRFGQVKTPEPSAHRPGSRDHSAPLGSSPVAASPVAAAAVVAPSSESTHSSASPQRPSLGTASIATTAMSEDQVQLDRLKDEARLSFMSFGTLNTSRGTSPTSSPTDEHHSFPRGVSPKRRTSLKGAGARRSASALAHRRDSQLLSGDVISQSKLLRPRSTYGFPAPMASPRASSCNGPRQRLSSTTTGAQAPAARAVGSEPPLEEVSTEHSSASTSPSSKPTGKRNRYSTCANPLPPASAAGEGPSAQRAVPETSSVRAASPTIPASMGTIVEPSAPPRAGSRSAHARPKSPAPRAPTLTVVGAASPGESGTTFLNTRDSSPEPAGSASSTARFYGSRRHSKSVHSLQTTPLSEEPPYHPPAPPPGTQSQPPPSYEEVEQQSRAFLAPLKPGSRSASAAGQHASDHGTEESRSSSADSSHHPPRSSSYFPHMKVAAVPVKTKAKPRSARVRNRKSLSSLRPIGPPSAPPPNMPLPSVPAGMAPAAPPPSGPLPKVPGMGMSSDQQGLRNTRMAA